ncbi:MULTISPECIES: hypothetical protein [Nocardia]|uniref:N-terminal of MaoC-like dehydratase domain-containing protein n=1 Tax=Nocardia rhizosphaerihabitans TaxID=1691570 RepID=A0ABQ2KG61_9NOCA|nr:hypothetical protein [Nocardia rhizosphaerihabitans]GGN80649.1 hypothetical protein GCM10011610_30230 [Nocardia rhizosphaerihabitans]
MSVPVETLQRELRGRRLPGGEITLERHETAIAEDALRAEPDGTDAAHPAWFIIASLRCMGVSVEELCALAHQDSGDTLLFGSCRIDQTNTLRAGATYAAQAHIGEVGSRHARDGSRLDSVEVVVELSEAGTPAGTITSTYLFKRGLA